MSNKKVISRAVWQAAEKDCFAYTTREGRFLEETKEDGQDGLTPVIILEDIKGIYDSLTENERFGIRFALFPLRIQAPMQQLGLTASDLMQYDEDVRRKSKP